MKGTDHYLLNLFVVGDLEGDLISPEKWQELYAEMPKICQEVVDQSSDQCIGIGKNDKLGWFIMGSGQGPVLLWSEHELKR